MMNDLEHMTVLEIKNIVHVQKNDHPGKIYTYTRSGGLPCHELIFKLSGKSEILFDEKRLCYGGGDIMFLPKGQGSELYRTKTLEVGDCIDILFDSSMPLFGEACVISSEKAAQLDSLFNKACDIWLKKEAGYYYLAMSLLYKMISVLTNELEKSSPASSDYEKIAPAVKYINEHFCEGETDFDALAEICKISYSYLRRLFTRCMGMPPAKYVMKRKIEYAAELLSSGRFNVGETADAVGFSDIYYFSKAFKEQVGVPPSKYKRIHGGN